MLNKCIENMFFMLQIITVTLYKIFLQEIHKISLEKL